MEFYTLTSRAICWVQVLNTRNFPTHTVSYDRSHKMNPKIQELSQNLSELSSDVLTFTKVQPYFFPD